MINILIYLIPTVLLPDIQHIVYKHIPQCPAQLVIVHVRFAFPYPPQPSHLVWILDNELSVVPLPGDHALVLLLLQQLQDEVPQLDLSGPGARLGLVGPVREGEPWAEGSRTERRRTGLRPVICPAACRGGLLSE